jgi:hypothetical protein
MTYGSKPACLASVYLWVTIRLRLPGAPSSCSRAGTVDAGKPSTLGDEGGLSKGAAWGLSKWEGPAIQGVFTPFAARLSCAFSSLPAISAPVRPLALALPCVFFFKPLPVLDCLRLKERDFS